jgi:glyoxylase-like metal-dependent hydrolase (beta-lactamase superfamily II)/rhodanese-related sulfurtransferase
MIFRQILYRDLGCASYFLADEGQAAVVDPRWDIEVYLELAAQEGVRIAHVLDTHMHADHVSGRERLAERTGARAYVPMDISFAGEDAIGHGHDEIMAGDTLTLGRLGLRAWATPGHRPEHLAIVVTDISRGDDPWMVLSGDSLLVGDLARPDLAVESHSGARELRASLGELLQLGDHVELWPAHVGGSLCGGAGLSGKTSSTIGYERRHNPLLESEEELFVAELLRDLPPRPPNLARVVTLNRERDARAPLPLSELDDDALAREVATGARVVDGRPPAAFDAGHLRGAINLPAGRSQGTRAGWVLNPDDRLVVVGSDRDHARQVALGLHAVGLWGVVGLAAGEPERWLDRGLEVQRASSWDVPTLAQRLGREEIQLIDVRERDEWESGHVQGSQSLPLHQLTDPDAIGLEQSGGPLAVICAGGIRAAFAASVIRGWGHAEVIRVSGGGVGNLPAHGIALVVDRTDTETGKDSEPAARAPA